MKAAVQARPVDRVAANYSIIELEIRMINIKVLGSGCANCLTTYQLIEEIAQAKGIDVELEKVKDIGDIMSYGVMSTPGVMVSEKLVHSGGIPTRPAIESWLT